MNKQELIEAVATKNNVTNIEAKKQLNAVLDAISEGTRKHGKVALVGFGSFSVVNRAARTGRNPQTGAELQIPAKDVVKFKASF